MSTIGQPTSLQELFRALPSVDRCLALLVQPDDDAEPALRRVAGLPRPLLHAAVTAYLDTIRAGIREGKYTDPGQLDLSRHLDALARFCLREASPHLARVVNGTGVVIHTNTGRSVLAKEAQAALAIAADGYSTLEFDRDTGGRGSRNNLVAYLLRQLAGAEDGMAVNNNAAGVLLAMDTFCRGGEVVISRGELVEIGGSFRIPEVMASTGVRLREVGSTNRTRLADYEQAIGEETRAIVRVHTSNYRIIGFHESVPTDALAALAHGRGLPLINDLGSGSLLDLTPYGLPREPTIPEAIRQGSDLVLCSGDKLLGGPQAGIIAGKAALLAKIRKNPLLRALRLDKLTLGALEATLRLYLDPEEALHKVPTLRMATLRRRTLAARAAALAARLRRLLGGRCRVDLVRGSSRMGGGAYPEADMPTTLVALFPRDFSSDALRLRLLETQPIVSGRIEGDAFCLDPRTLVEGDARRIESALAQAFGPEGGR